MVRFEKRVKEARSPSGFVYDVDFRLGGCRNLVPDRHAVMEGAMSITETFHVRLTPEEAERIRDIAAAEDHSMHWVLRKLIEVGLESNKYGVTEEQHEANSKSRRT